MEHLPDELILMILNKLMITNKVNILNDLLECRLVCRRWNELVKLIRIRTLKDSGRYPYDFVQIDLFSIDLNPVLFEANITVFLKSTLMKTILSRLKQVCFCDVEIRTKLAWTRFEKSLQQLR